MTVIFGFITLFLFGYIIFGLIKLPFDLFSGYRKFSKEYDATYNPSHLTTEHPMLNAFINNYPYCKTLSAEAKNKFVSRLVRFLSDKKFVGVNGVTVTDEIRTEISACAVQLTFGLYEYMLPLFHTIEIFPNEFYSRGMKKYLKGGTSPAGIIMLSWNDFQKGFADLHDKYNLGLHEMAHALLANLLYGDADNSQLRNHIGEWEKTGDVELEKLRQRQPHFLRAYAGTNEHEFFAVSVEHFFEVPDEFKKNLPDLYRKLTILLNQDPLNISGDYKLI